MKSLASLVGLLQSCRLVIGPLVSIMWRSLYDTTKSAKTWSSWISLNDLAEFQIQWWLTNLPELYEYPISSDSSLTHFEFSIASDAGNSFFVCLQSCF